MSADDVEAFAEAGDGGSFAGAEFDTAVGGELLAAQPEQFPRVDAVAGEEAAHRVRGPVARLARVDDEHLPPAARQDQRGAQTRRTTANDDDLVEVAGSVQTSVDLAGDPAQGSSLKQGPIV